MAKKTEGSAPEPMDSNVPTTTSVGRVSTNTPRNVYAIETLVKEVLDLFPETTFTTEDVDGRNAAHTVVFEIDEEPELVEVLRLIATDERVQYVYFREGDGLVKVAFTHNARLKDSREPFNLVDAFEVMLGEEEGSL